MEEAQAICNRRWEAPRVEVESVPVTHVCALKLGHAGVCACSCGRIRLELREPTGRVELRYPVALSKEDEGKWIVFETPPAKSIEVPRER